MPRRSSAIVAVVLAASLAGCGQVTTPTAVTREPGGPLPVRVFVAQYATRSEDTGVGHGTFLSLLSERSGNRTRDLVHVPEESPADLSGYSRAGDGDVYYALARGPFPRSNVNGGDPAPGSCGGTVDRVDARTGKTHTVFAVGADWTVASPVLSPDGTMLAYLSQRCTAEFAQAVVVRDLVSGRERRIFVAGGSALTPSWSSDGSRLIFPVFFADQRGAANHPGFVIAAATSSGRRPRRAVRHAPQHGCVVQGATFDKAGIALTEGCPSTVTVPARLVQLDASGNEVMWSRSTGLCPNGMTAVADPVIRRLLVTGTTACRDGFPLADVVQEWSGRHYRVLGRYVNPRQFVDGAA